MDMSIAALSVNMHQAQSANNLGLAVLKMAMNSAETTGASEFIDEVASSVSLDPNLGNNLDVYA